MDKNRPDIKADAKPVIDRNESVSLMEPLLVATESRFTVQITDLTVELAARATGFRRSLPDDVLSQIDSSFE